MRIKICGITRLEDAREAVRLGADWLGFNFFAGSPRYIQVSECVHIVSALRAEGRVAMMTGVFVNAPAVEVLRIARVCGLDRAQLSGDETPATLAEITAAGLPAYKAVRAPLDPALIERYVTASAGAPALLIDGAAPGAYGGTGRTADWDAAAAIAARHPIFLAGGLTPENAAEAVRRVDPWGVDASSGVESAPGVKDAAKMAAFIRTAREAAPQADLRIETAGPGDAEEILSLQKLAYQSEAELNDDFNIPPLTQTLAELRSEFGRMTILKAIVDGEIVGSARADLQGGTCRIGRVIVHPERQNRGIGTRVLRELEARFEGALRYELFTSERSARNLYLYQKGGYRIFRREPLNEKVALVYLEKTGSKTA